MHQRKPYTIYGIFTLRYCIWSRKKWAEQFKDMMIPNPGWYHSSMNTFVASDFIAHMNGMSSALSAAATPASSGSGGGGFSGGGGGGGGGGSW
jgi:uncharacterized membrane protein